MNLKVADSISRHSLSVNWPLANGNRRSCTDRSRLPQLSHSSNTVCISCFKSWCWSLSRVHWSRKCSTSSGGSRK